MNIEAMTLQPESIAIVLPVHNRKRMTLACLSSLLRQRIRGFQIILVDSGSTDGTADAVKAEFPNVTVLRHGNLWWAGATNKGVECALAGRANYVLTINDDLEFAEDYLEAMMCAAKSHPLALMGSHTFDFDTKQPIYCGHLIDWKTASNCELLQTVPSEHRHGLYGVTCYSARGLWIPAKVFLKIGLFDEKHLPHYTADMDFTARAAGAGFEMKVNCDAVLFNHQDQSGAREAFENYNWHNYWKHLFGIQGAGNLRNFTIFAFRHCPRRYLPFYWTIGIIKCLGGYLYSWLKHKLSHIGRECR
ncbi:MAG: glycosyltransferase family 2 protein [Terracidiphilus sp.]|jgi:GT2 family glycosyltransferase